MEGTVMMGKVHCDSRNGCNKCKELLGMGLQMNLL